MKTTILALITILSIAMLHGQSTDDTKIRLTLTNYIEGSSYNKLDQIKKAFADNATLYLTNKEGEFKKYTPQQYTDFFKHRESGKFNGRVGKIIEIQIDRDIATAKAEIVIAERNTKYIDLFLLKNIEGEGWKIISKTATLTNYEAHVEPK
ncbi:MAG: nuclear transport factor 2 family protein [Maribacter litoralis]|uniref:nuclear transport factor 2 family protein n=1 Tax=Maribacter litoralis TaxID=2059726 RepID=UPI0032989A69